MASQELLSALDGLNINNAADRTEAQTTFTTVGLKPNELLTHTEKKTYILTGLKPTDFMKKHGGPEFSFDELVFKFNTICTDYSSPLSVDTQSKAVEFCSKIIYEVGPMTRQVTKAGGDEVYKFMFMYAHNDIRVAFVSTFKSNDPTTDYVQGQKIILTIKQAMLLAVKTLEQLNCLGAQIQPTPVYLLTPLAGAVFSKEDINSIATRLSKTSSSILNSINSSSQSGGQYLMSSNLACAAVCAIMSTKGLKDKDIRVSIICKSMRQYISKNKEFSIGDFEVYAEFAHGGIPDGLEPENLMDLLSKVQERTLTARRAVEASRQTVVNTTVTAGGSGN